jgi:predicted translin family RNA/ssDNA-binding protein
MLSMNHEALQGYLQISGELKRELFKSFLTNRKASLFLESCFKNISEKFRLPLLLNKGNYYELIQFINPKDIEPEVKEKLDYLFQYLS